MDFGFLEKYGFRLHAHTGSHAAYKLELCYLKDQVPFYSITYIEHQNYIRFIIQDRCEKTRILLSHCVHELIQQFKHHAKYRLRVLYFDFYFKYDEHTVTDFEKYEHITNAKHYNELKDHIHLLCKQTVTRKRHISIIEVHGQEGRILHQIFTELGYGRKHLSYTRFVHLYLPFPHPQEMIATLCNMGFRCKQIA